jgi:hypothetical protein
VSISYRHHSYNSKITVYKLSVIVLQTVCNFTDSLNLSPHSLFSTSLKLSITTSYRQLTHHHCTCPRGWAGGAPGSFGGSSLTASLAHVAISLSFFFCHRKNIEVGRVGCSVDRHGPVCTAWTREKYLVKA